MDIQALLASHVYTAIALGSIVEGETTVVLAGYAAHQGYVPWWSAALLAAGINFCWDQAYYLLGRWRGEWILGVLPRLREGVDRVSPHVHRHRRWLIFGIRFLYGLRTAGPIALGIARVPWRDFILFNALGALAWAALFSALGYAFGHTMAALVGEVRHYEGRAAAIILAGGAAAFVIARLVARRASRREPG